jgi:hypothetical protein
MMTLSSRVAATAVASLLLMGSAFAQTSAPATPAEKAEPAAKRAEKPRSPESIACSAEADAKNLHGRKERKPFMRECKRAARAKAEGEKKQ